MSLAVPAAMEAVLREADAAVARLDEISFSGAMRRAHIGLFGMGLANWVVHSLLMLAILRLKQRDAALGEVGDSPKDEPSQNGRLR